MSLTVVTSRLLLLPAVFVDFYKFLSLSLEGFLLCFFLVILSFASGLSLLFHVIFLSIPSLSFVLLVVEFLGASCVSKLSKTCAAVKGKILGDMIDRSMKQCCAR